MTEMSPAEAIYFGALEKATTSERDAYLDAACVDDPALRARVEKLLAAEPQVGSFLNTNAAVELTRALEPIAEEVGTSIGPYRLLQQIGEGGMGTVFMAEQQSPVRRKVALKIIKPGMDSKQVVARFEAERQALAMMDHTNIAKVFDAGTTDSGRPYFVMELVHGVPIVDYCDANKLSPNERLELFVAVCQAIQHAHQKGIIHRDIKPSNVLVTMYDDKPVPKVIDFGVAKAVEQKLTEKTLFTQYWALVGTFEYMSPEQAEMNAFGVDTRSDVYSLGVLLYELLTGTTPLDRQSLREAAYGEIVRLIKEKEPVRPSIQLSSSGTLSKVAEARRMEPAKLSSLVRGELDWIVMRCLEKDRTRRYEGASDLAKDVQRYLTGDAVEACSPTLTYRFSKFVKRNRPQVLAGTVVLVALLIGICGTTFGLIRAHREQQIANEQRIAAERERSIAEQASDEKAQAIDRTLNVLDEVTSRDMLEAMITQRDISDGQKHFLDVILNHFEEVSQQKGNDEATRFRTAKAAYRVGEIQAVLGRYDTAVASTVRARDGFAELVAEFPKNLDYHYHLAQSLGSIGQLRIYEGNYPAADEAWEKAEQAYERLIDAKPEVTQSHIDLARLLASHGKLLAWNRPDDADRLLERAVNMMEQQARDSEDREVLSALAKTYEGVAVYSRADLSVRQAMTEKSYDIRKQLSDEQPDSAYALHSLGRSIWSLGRLSAEQEQWPEAEKWYREALDIHRDVLKRFPNIARGEDAVGYSFGRLAYVLEKQEKWSDAERNYRESLLLKERQVREMKAPQAKRQLITVYGGLIRVLEATGQAEKNPEVYELEVKRARLTVSKDEDSLRLEPDRIDKQIELGSSKTRLAATILAPDQFDDSVAGSLVDRANECLLVLDEADRLLKPHIKHETLAESDAESFALSQSHRGTAYACLNQHEKAAAAFGSAIELSKSDEARALQYEQALARVHFESVAEVIKEVESLGGDRGDDIMEDGRDLFVQALIYSVASERSDAETDSYATTAIQFLRQALQTKTSDAAIPGQWQHHPDLDPLRDREDFQSLVAEQMAEDSAA